MIMKRKEIEKENKLVSNWTKSLPTIESETFLGCHHADVDAFM